MRRLLGRSSGLTAVGLAGLVGLAVPAAVVPAAAQTSGDEFTVTFVARECPSYGDVMANIERNNLMESLRDLGPDSVYTHHQPVDPDIEAANDPNCTPLDGWQFDLGDGFDGKQDGLSLVSDPNGTTPPTRDGVPRLDADGNPTGDSLDGAVTVTLTEEQMRLARQGRLTTQGGLVDDPLMQQRFGEGTYGYAVMRCAIDNLNGDNVEYVSYPAGSRHVFCYYYAVTPPPEAAEIVVRKELPPGYDDTASFPFGGNVSYNEGGRFDLEVEDGEPAEMVFERGSTLAGDEPWVITEQPVPGWRLRSLTCRSRDGTSETTVTGGTASIDLGGGDRVTCTYVDERDLDHPLSVFKRTSGGVGGPFDVSVRDPDGQTADLGSATTTEQNRPVEVGEVASGTAGTYQVTETLPSPTDAGYWTSDGIQCNGVGSGTDPRRETASYPVEVGETPQNCVLTNTWHPTGRIDVSKTTLDGLGSATFVLVPMDTPARPATRDPYDRRHVTTTSPGEPAAADPFTGLPTGRYTITELADTEGEWIPESVTCDGVTGTPPNVVVEITAEDPEVECSFTNRVPGDPTPPPSPEPTPTPTPTPTPEPTPEPTSTPSEPGETGKPDEPGDAGPPGKSVIGRPLPDTGAGGIVGLAAASLGTVLAGLAVLVFTLVRRRRSGPVD